MLESVNYKVQHQTLVAFTDETKTADFHVHGSSEGVITPAGDRERCRTQCGISNQVSIFIFKQLENEFLFRPRISTETC